MSTPFAEIAAAATQPEQVAARARKSPGLVAQIIQGLDSEKTRVKFGSAKALRIVARERPEILYPHFDVFVRLLEHKNKILQWEGAIVLSHLVAVDIDDKFTPLFEKYFSPISGPVMITAANVIGGAARIARSRPGLADRIATEVLKVRRARYATPECRNVAIGHAITALGDFFDLVGNSGPVLRFVRGQLKNTRPATRKKAEQFLKEACK